MHDGDPASILAKAPSIVGVTTPRAALFAAITLSLHRYSNLSSVLDGWNWGNPLVLQ